MDSLDNVVHKYGSAEHVVKRRGHPTDDSASTPIRPTMKSSHVTVSINNYYNYVHYDSFVLSLSICFQVTIMNPSGKRSNG